MTERTQNILAFGFLLILLCAVGLAFSKCDGVNHLPGSGKVIRDTVYVVTTLPPSIDTVRAYIRVVKHDLTTDTIIKTDTFFRDLPPFSLVGESFVTSKRDTITARYNYPANQFAYEARYSPDSVLTVTNTVTIPPQRLQFGAQFGVGAAYCMDGVIRPAAFVGVGINWRF
jgi:hypothetical protein